MKNVRDFMEKRGYLSPSSIGMFRRCPRQWYYRYIEGVKSPPNGSMVVGSSAHSALEENFTRKIEVDQDMPEEELLDVYSDEFEKMNEEQKVVYGDYDKGVYKDGGVKALSKHRRVLTPSIQPEKVEEEVTRSIPETPFDMLGIIDVVEKDAIRDHKFSKRLKSKKSADSSSQLSAYAWLMEDKQPVSEVSFEVATLAGKARRVDSERNSKQLRIYEQNYLVPTAKQIYHSLKTGNFPVDPEGWWCSKSTCGYWHLCPAGENAYK